MKWHLLSMTALLFLMARITAAAEPATQPTRTASGGQWIALFDGKNTDAWRSWNSDRFPAKGWVIEDGCLKLEKSNGRLNGGGGEIVTRQEFTDFELSWEWKMSKGGNSGVEYLLGKPKNAKAMLSKGDAEKDLWGHEYQLLDDTAYPEGKLEPQRRTASFYSIIAPNDLKRLRPLGEFNESRLLIRGNHVEHWLNGAKVVEYELGSPPIMAAVEKSKFKTIPGFGTKHKSAILLQDHGSAIWFRNIRIRMLDAEKTR